MRFIHLVEKKMGWTFKLFLNRFRGSVYITHATYDILNNAFLFAWNANLIIYKENFLFVIISVKHRILIQVKNLT